jgi:hypothetical protein
MRERRDRINSVAKCAEELGNALSCLDGSLRFGGCNISDRHPRNASRRFLWFLKCLPRMDPLMIDLMVNVFLIPWLMSF